IGHALVLAFVPMSQGAAQTAKTAYPKTAPLSQYLMPRDAEIALARSAAPPSISGNAEILILAKDGFGAAVKGSNGFVCMVARSWSAEYSDPGFWDPNCAEHLRLQPELCRSHGGSLRRASGRSHDVGHDGG